MDVDQIAKDLNSNHVDDVSEALCEHLDTGKLICLRMDIEKEIRERYEK